MKLSQKKQDELWSAVNNSIMDARIKIARLSPGNELLMKVDDILYHASIDAPKDAIQIFSKSIKSLEEK